MNPDVEWSTREKLSLSSYVLQSGNQHWSGSVTRMLRSLGEANRPADWFSAKNCAQQYSALIESAETPRRKRGERSESSESASGVNSPATLSIGDAIMKKLTQERIEELRKQIRSERAKYKKLKNTLTQIENGELDDKLDEMIAEIQRKKAEETKPEDLEADNNPVAQVHQTTVADTEMEDIVEPEEQKLEEKYSPPQPNSTKIPGEQNSLVSTSVDEPKQSEINVVVEANEEEVEAMDTTATADDEASNSPPVFNSRDANSNTLIKSIVPDEPPTINNDQQELHVSGEEQPQSPVNEETCATTEDVVPSPVTIESPQPEVNVSRNNYEEHTPQLTPDVPTDEVSAPIVELEPRTPIETSNEHTMVDTVEELDTNQEPVNPEPQNQKELMTFTEPQPSVDAIEETVNTDVVEDEEEVKTENETSEDKGSIEDVTKVSTTKDVVPEIQDKEVESIVEEDNISHASMSVAEDGDLSEQNEGYSASMPSTPAYIDSFPSSPALSTTSDVDPEATANFRAWKKSIMILWKQVASHRYASLFLQPVTDDIAPNYSNIVYRAMDLSTLKKHLETGVVRTTSEFQRDLMLMFQNALMYNNREHDVYKMALDMQKDVMDQVAQFLATQLMMETAQQSTPKGLRRSTLRKSAMSEKVSEARSKRTAAIEGELKFMKKKPPHE